MIKVIIAVVLVICIISVGWFVIFRTNLSFIKSQSSSNSNAQTISDNKASKYNNSTFGYSLTLPKGWTVCGSADSEPTVRIGLNQKCGLSWDESFLLTPTVGADYIHDRRQNEPFLFFVKRIEDEDKDLLKSSGKVDYKLTQVDQQTVMVESTYTPTDKSIKPKFQVSLYREMSPLETVILNSEESEDAKTLDKKTLLDIGKSVINSSVETGNLIGRVSKNIPNGQSIYSDYKFGIVMKDNNKEITLKTDNSGAFMATLNPGEYILKTLDGDKSFTIEKGRILRLNFIAN